MSSHLNHYHFLSSWTLPEGAERVYEVLRRLETYPRWWPEVREVSLLDESSAAVRIRALLPYSLRFSMFQEVADREAGVLRVRLAGDLEGYSSWTIEGGSRESSLRFEQEVVVNKTLLRALAPVARPLFKLNHSVMMFRGRRGLRRYLAMRRDRGMYDGQP